MPCTCSVRSPRITNLRRSSQAKDYCRQALTLAEELGHAARSWRTATVGLGLLYVATSQREQARAALSTAIDLYHAMEMTFWLPQTEAALVQVEEDTEGH